MSSFKEILKSRRQEGSGLITSVASTSFDKTRERLDIRNVLFKDKSLLNALFPSIIGFKASAKNNLKDLKSSSSEKEGSVVDTLIIEKLDIIGKHTLIAAKNSIVLPSMARDVFLMNKNLIKLVKLQGDTPRTKAGDWFSRQLERENRFEEMLKEKKKPSPVSFKETETKKEGFFSSLFKPLLTFFSGFLAGGLFSTLIKGGLIAGILMLIGENVRKFFSDPDFREKVLESMGKAFSDTWKFLTETETGKNLLTGIAVVGAAFIGLKLAIATITTAIIVAAARISAAVGLGTLLPVPGRKPGKRKQRGGLLSLLPTAILGALGYNLLSNSESDESIPNGEIDSEGFDLEAAAVAGGAGYLSYKFFDRLFTQKTTTGVGKGGKPYSRDMAGRRVRDTKWVRFLKFLEKKDLKLWKKVGPRLIAMGAGFVVPVVGWLFNLINVLGNISLAWQVYNYWKEFNNEDKNDTSPINKSEQNTPIPTPKTDDIDSYEMIAGLYNRPSSEQNTPTVSSTVPTRTYSSSNNDIISYIKSKEGFRSKAYHDGRQWSIGYGTKAKNKNEVITEDEADIRIQEEVMKLDKMVRNYSKKHKYNWNENQIKSLISFTYNLGSGSLNQLTKNGTRTNEEISKVILEYNKAATGKGKDKKSLPGLTTRRQEERDMFLAKDVATEQDLRVPEQIADLSKKGAGKFMSWWSDWWSKDKTTMPQRMPSNLVEKVDNNEDDFFTKLKKLTESQFSDLKLDSVLNLDKTDNIKNIIGQNKILSSIFDQKELDHFFKALNQSSNSIISGELLNELGMERNMQKLSTRDLGNIVNHINNNTNQNNVNQSAPQGIVPSTYDERLIEYLFGTAS